MQSAFRRSCALLFLGALALPAVGQDIFIASETDMILTRANDLNGNNSANDPGEYTKCAYSLSLLQRAEDLKYTNLFGAPTLLWLDEINAVNGIVRLTDTNGNGVFEPSEITLLLGAFHTKIGQSSAGNTFLGGFCQGPNSDLFISNNQFTTNPAILATNGLYRVTNVTTTPVVTAALKGSDVVTAYEDFATPSTATISSGSFERIVCNKNTGKFYAYNTLDDVIYLLQDLDSDGKFTTPGEVVNYLNVGLHKAGLNFNPDFGPTGPLGPTYGAKFQCVAANATHFNRLTLLYVEVNETTGDLFIGTRTQPMDASLPGCASLDVSGIILRCRDLNGNGTCNDAGEVTVYCDPYVSFASFNLNGLPYKPTSSATPGYSGLGIDNSTGTVYALVNTGPVDPAGTFTQDIVWKLVDLDSDGNVSGPGEQIPINIQRPAGSFSKELEIVPNGIFATPFCAAMSHETAGAQSPLPNSVGCNTPPNLALKTSVRFYKGPPHLGNSNFQISVTGTRIGSTFAQLWISQADWDPVQVKWLWDLLNGFPYFVGLPYPSDLSSRNIDEWLPIGFWNTGSPMYIDLLDLSFTGTFYLENGLNVEIGSTTGGVFTPGAPAAGDTINGKCTVGTTTGVPYVGRFDANVSVPSSPFLAGQVFRCQWFTEDPQTPNPPIPYAVSDVGILRIQ